jgi:hypothetical protein
MRRNGELNARRQKQKPEIIMRTLVTINNFQFQLINGFDNEAVPEMASGRGERNTFIMKK